MDNKITSNKILFNRQVNYIIIQKLWKYLERKYPGFNNGETLYDRLDITANMYSRILTANTYQRVDLDKKWKVQNSKLKRIGLSEEIMTGREMLIIDDITKDDWVSYIRYRYDKDIDGNDEYIRKSYMAYFNRKIASLFATLVEDKKAEKDISKLYYFLKNNVSVNEYIPDREMNELRNALLQIKIEHIKDCETKIRQEVKELLVKRLHEVTIIMEYIELK